MSKSGSRKSPLDYLCIFCYKSTGIKVKLKQANYHRTNENTESFKSFIRLAERFVLRGDEEVNDYSSKEIDKWLDWCDYCKDCGVILDSFCAIFQKLKSLELLLEWKLGTLVNIMKLANRVPSRVQQLRLLFQEKMLDSENKVTNGKSGLRRNDKRICGETRLTNLKLFRTEFIRKCSSRLTKSQPRVFLKRRNSNKLTDEPKFVRQNDRRRGEEVRSPTLVPDEIDIDDDVPVVPRKQRKAKYSRSKNNHKSKTLLHQSSDSDDDSSVSVIEIEDSDDPLTENGTSAIKHIDLKNGIAKPHAKNQDLIKDSVKCSRNPSDELCDPVEISHDCDPFEENVGVLSPVSIQPDEEINLENCEDFEILTGEQTWFQDQFTQDDKANGEGESEKSGIDSGMLGQYLFCNLDGCNFKLRYDNPVNKRQYEDHQKLHEQGQYNCGYCDVVESNLIKLSRHERSAHPDV